MANHTQAMTNRTGSIPVNPQRLPTSLRAAITSLRSPVILNLTPTKSYRYPRGSSNGFRKVGGRIAAGLDQVSLRPLVPRAGRSGLGSKMATRELAHQGTPRINLEPMPESRWLSIRQIARDLGVSSSTAYKWSSRGQPWFPRSIRLRNGDIRVRRDWYEAWLKILEQ